MAVWGTVDFCGVGEPVRLAGVRLPDVFDPAWPAQATARAAEVCAPRCNDARVVGWLTDDGAGWASLPAADRPGLLQVCLSLEPDLAAYHAAWEFVLALHQGRLDELAAAWAVALPNKESLRAMTRQEQGIATEGCCRDTERWVREYGRRYFSVAARAIREHAPHHLVLGCRWRDTPSLRLLDECVSIADVCLVGSEQLPEGASAPVMLGDFDWTREGLVPTGRPAFERDPAARAPALRRARLALARAIAHPAVVGYAWSRWQDRPGEPAPGGSGLVHCNGIEACEHTEWLTALHDRVDDIRAMALIPEDNP